MVTIIFKRETFPYILFFTILTGAKAFGLDGKNLTFILVTVFALILLSIKILFERYTYKEFIQIILILLLGILILIFSKKPTILITIIAIVFSKNVDKDDLIKKVFFIRVISFIFVIMLSLLGVVENVKQFRFLESGKIITRYSLGFSHPNVTFLNFFIIVVLFLFIYFDKLKPRNYIIISILSYIMYLITDSRTGLLITILSLLITLVFRTISIGNKKVINFIIVSIPTLCASLSVLGAFYYSKQNMILNNLDKLLSGRLQLSKRFLNMYNIKLFGQKIVEGSDINGAYLRIDNGYINLLLGYGIIIFILYIIFQTMILKRYIMQNRYKEIMLIIIFLIYGITEVYIYNIFVNISLLFISDLLYIKKSTKRIKK